MKKLFINMLISTSILHSLHSMKQEKLILPCTELEKPRYQDKIEKIFQQQSKEYKTLNSFVHAFLNEDLTLHEHTRDFLFKDYKDKNITHEYDFGRGFRFIQHGILRAQKSKIEFTTRFPSSISDFAEDQISVLFMRRFNQFYSIQNTHQSLEGLALKHRRMFEACFAEDIESFKIACAMEPPLAKKTFEECFQEFQ